MIEIPDDQEDWIRELSFDFPDVTTVEELQATIDPITLVHFMKLPAAKPMPRELKKAVFAKLRTK